MRWQYDEGKKNLIFFEKDWNCLIIVFYEVMVKIEANNIIFRD